MRRRWNWPSSWDMPRETLLRMWKATMLAVKSAFWLPWLLAPTYIPVMYIQRESLMSRWEMWDMPRLGAV